MLCWPCFFFHPSCAFVTYEKMESADQAVAEVGTSHICSSYPSCHLHVFSLKSWEPGGNHFLLTESLSLITQKTYSQQLMESLLWFVYNVSSHLLPSPLFCPSSTGPRWSPCSSKSALHANSPCWMPPLASLSGARLVRMIFFLPHPVPHLTPILFVPLHVPEFPKDDRGLDLCEGCGNGKENAQALLSVGSRRKRREKSDGWEKDWEKVLII